MYNYNMYNYNYILNSHTEQLVNLIKCYISLTRKLIEYYFIFTNFCLFNIIFIITF